MNHLAGTSCYLVGPVEHDKKFGRDWREVVSQRLSSLGIKVYNPLGRSKWWNPIKNLIPPYLSRQDILSMIEKGNKDVEVAQILVRKICMRMVATCDFIVCYLPSTKTYGSVEELSVASNLNKPIIAICPDEMPSLWMWDILKSDKVVNDIESAIGYLKNIDDGIEHLDAIKWIFVGDEYDNKSIEFDSR